jgi:hypothetical protein
MRLKLLFAFIFMFGGIMVTIMMPFLEVAFHEQVARQLHTPLWTIKTGSGVGEAIGIFALLGFTLGWAMEKILEKIFRRCHQR